VKLLTFLGRNGRLNFWINFGDYAIALYQSSWSECSAKRYSDATIIRIGRLCLALVHRTRRSRDSRLLQPDRARLGSWYILHPALLKQYRWHQKHPFPPQT